jgi:hypothetical protein
VKRSIIRGTKQQNLLRWTHDPVQPERNRAIAAVCHKLLFKLHTSVEK